MHLLMDDEISAVMLDCSKCRRSKNSNTHDLYGMLGLYPGGQICNRGALQVSPKVLGSLTCHEHHLRYRPSKRLIKADRQLSQRSSIVDRICTRKSSGVWIFLQLPSTSLSLSMNLLSQILDKVTDCVIARIGEVLYYRPTRDLLFRSSCASNISACTISRKIMHYRA